MSLKKYRLPVAVALAIVATHAWGAFGDLFKSAESFLGGDGLQQTSALTDGQIDAGLKEALSIGAERAVAVLGRSGGFLEDGSVRIPLPGALDKVARGLRTVGQGKYVDEFETTMNRAAEQAVPKTLAIVKDTVSRMSLSDVRGILKGGDDAATRYLRDNAGPAMQKAIEPIVSDATNRAGATAAYKNLKSRAGGGLGMLGGLMDTDSLDLDKYVTGKALDGLFLKLAAEEKKIRENPLARSTDLLKKVFAN